MGRARDEQTWRHYSDPQGIFRIEIPASWQVQVNRTIGKFTHTQQGRVWEGERFTTTLQSPAGGDEEWRLSVSLRIERYSEVPPPILKGLPEPTDIRYFRRYRISHDADWLTCVVGHLRMHINYELQALSPAYHHPHSHQELPAPVSPDERRKWLTLVQRIINSFELVASR